MKKKEIARFSINATFLLILAFIVLRSDFNIVEKIRNFIFGMMLIGFIAEWIIIFIFGREN